MCVRVCVSEAVHNGSLQFAQNATDGFVILFTHYWIVIIKEFILQFYI